MIKETIKNLTEKQVKEELKKRNIIGFPTTGVNFIWHKGQALWKRYSDGEGGYKDLGALEIYMEEEKGEEMPLHTKYEIQTLEEFAGHAEMKASLESVLTRKSDIPHSYLFTGPAGCGKTSLARLVGKQLGCEVQYFNAANTRGIDTVRAIKEDSDFAPLQGVRKMYILDEVHQITGVAQEALLQLILEPPSHVYFALCTTQPESLKDTFIRRPHHFIVKHLNLQQVIAVLKEVCKKEGVEDYWDSVLQKIANISWGSVGQALKLLDQVIDMEEEEKALNILEEVEVGETTVVEICRILVDTKLSGGNKWEQLKVKLSKWEGNAEQARRGILGYMEKVLFSTGSEVVAEMMGIFADGNFMWSGRPGLSVACYLATKVK